MLFIYDSLPQYTWGELAKYKVRAIHEPMDYMSPYYSWTYVIHESTLLVSLFDSWVRVLCDRVFPGEMQHTATSPHHR